MNSKQWQLWAIRRYGSLEAAKEIRREAGEKSINHPNRQKGTDKTGWSVLKKNNPELHAELSKKGGERSKRGKAKETEETEMA